MGQMTKIQFDTIRALACAYGHEWANELDFARVWAEGTTRGVAYRADAVDPENPHRASMAAWVDLHDRIEAGYVPTTEEIELLATPLFDDDHYPSTCYVALVHETCTHRTRWRVDVDGTVWFGFYDDRADGRGMFPICEISTYICRGGFRVAWVDYAVPVAQWGDEHTNRIRRALAAIGMSTAEIDRAFAGARPAKLQWKRFGMVVIEDGQRRNYGISPWPSGDYASRFASGVILSWDGERIAVEQRWGASMGDDVEALAHEACVLPWGYTASQRAIDASYELPSSAPPKHRQRPAVTPRIVRGSRRHARRRVNR